MHSAPRHWAEWHRQRRHAAVEGILPRASDAPSQAQLLSKWAVDAFAIQASATAGTSLKSLDYGSWLFDRGWYSNTSNA